MRERPWLALSGLAAHRLLVGGSWCWWRSARDTPATGWRHTALAACCALLLVTGTTGALVPAGAPRRSCGGPTPSSACSPGLLPPAL